MASDLVERPWRRLPIAAAVALFAATLAATISRTARLPNDYAEAQWLLDWRFGFVKRGLMGTLVSLWTVATGASITAHLIAGLSIAMFATFAAAMLWVAVRICRRCDWSADAVIAGLVFLSAPFFVMQTDVIGYFDAIVLTLAVASVALLLRGRAWAAVAVQCVALLIHEQGLVLGLPLLVLARMSMDRGRRTADGQQRPLWSAWLPLLLPVAFAGALVLIWGHTTTPALVARYLSRLQEAGFVGENRDIWAPQWIFRSFADSFAAERPVLFDRLESVNMLRLVAPSMLVFFCVAVERCRLPILSLETAAFAAATLAPQTMHLVAWDTPRIWTYSSATSFLALWVFIDTRECRRPSRSGVLVGCWAVVVHAFTKTPLLDVAYESFNGASRALTYGPAMATAATLAAAGRCDIMTVHMNGGETTSTQPRLPALRIGIAVGMLLFVIAVLRTAWVGDDAYITFRSIDNLIHGHGFRWNVVERVQPFTHPLWALFLVVPFWLTGEAYFTSIGISAALSVAAVWILATRVAGSQRAAILGLAVFVFSKAFVEYSTSGLENPLTTFLLAALLAVYWSSADRRFERLWLVGGLLMLNRLDLALLVLPLLGTESLRQPRRRAIRAAIIGLAPLAAWELFSVVYYGFLFPNTAYAKLQTGIGAGELLTQGLLYLLDSVSADPVTLLVTFAGLLAFAHDRRRLDNWPIALGTLLYLLYIVRIGGDFMSGRFLVAPLVCATALLMRLDWNARAAALAPLVATVALLGTFATVRPPITSTIGTYAMSEADGMGVGAVADERAYYYRYAGLLRWTREVPLPHESLMVDAAKALRGVHEVMATRNIGFFGYFAGPTVHIVDLMALSDPLLARQPAIRPWRIGHFERRLPEGYLDSIRSGRNEITDLSIAATFEQLKLVTQGPLWDRRRWRVIRRLNFGW